MNGIENEIPVWPRARWVWSVIVVLALQLALVFVFADLKPVMPRRVETGTSLSLITDRAAAERLAQSVAANDPTMYALANPRGFSGPAWLQVPPLEHRLTDWKDQEHWLTPSNAQYGSEFSGYVRRNAMTTDRAPVMPDPQLDKVQPENPDLLEKSQLVVSGDLKKRKLLSNPKLPTWPSSDILGNTVVQVVVNDEGDTVSMTLLSSAGLSLADDKALAMARDLQFAKAPKGGPELTWGQLVFRWKTVPQATTNSVSSNP